MTRTIGEEPFGVCSHPSKTYKGPCFNNHNCRIICKAEGAVGGHCRFFSFRCVCETCDHYNAGAIQRLKRTDFICRCLNVDSANNTCSWVVSHVFSLVSHGLWSRDELDKVGSELAQRELRDD
nr:defensin-like protein 1 [Tanacetum cinerariifolium]